MLAVRTSTSAFWGHNSAHDKCQPCTGIAEDTVANQLHTGASMEQKEYFHKIFSDRDECYLEIKQGTYIKTQVTFLASVII